MEALIFTLGMLVRSIFFLLPSIEKWDFLKALGALSVSALIAGQSGADPILMPVFFLFLTAFLFRARLVPRVTKHLLLIYAVIALLLFVSKIYENNWLFTFADVFWGILIIPLTLFVTIASFRNTYFSDSQEIFLMYSFFFLNIFIIFTGSTSMYVTLYNQSLLFFFSAGFFYFQILCNIIYATTFIFLHTKTFGRILTETMTKSFVNVDMKRSGIAVLYSILGLFLVNGYFGIIDTWTAIALATTAGSAIVSTEYFY